MFGLDQILSGEFHIVDAIFLLGHSTNLSITRDRKETNTAVRCSHSLHECVSHQQISFLAQGAVNLSTRNTGAETMPVPKQVPKVAELERKSAPSKKH